MKIDINKALAYLNELFPDAKCSLDYSKDYELLIATVLSAQTTDKAVNQATSVLFNKYTTINDLKNADYDSVYSIISRLGLAKTKARNIIGIANELVEKYDGIVPNNEEALLSLPGVGNKTKNVVMAELFDKPYIAVDTHVLRISKRWGIASKNDDPLAAEHKLYKVLPKKNIKLINHQLIEFGREICKAPKPLCEKCKLNSVCPKITVKV